jgi:ElaB/YqjD/DUF883 family membrane-anchored ribosome-binding protein
MATNYNPNEPGKEHTGTGATGGTQGTRGEGTMEEMKERVEEQVTKMKEQVQETYQAGKAKVGEMVEDVKQKLPSINRGSLENLYRDTIDYVQANPDKALFASLAIGFILGSLFRRK